MTKSADLILDVKKDRHGLYSWRIVRRGCSVAIYFPGVATGGFGFESFDAACNAVREAGWRQAPNGSVYLDTAKMPGW